MDLLKMRTALLKKDIPTAVRLISKIDASAPPPKELLPKFQKELVLAKTITHVVRLQSKVEVDMSTALEAMDVKTIQRLLLQSEALDMNDNPIVVRGRKEINVILVRKRVMCKMVEFLQNENDHFDTISEALRVAVEINVDSAFIDKVRRVYDVTAPRILARNSLRTAIETVHYGCLVTALHDVLDIQRFQQNFAETEVRCGRNLLKLLSLEEELLKTETNRIGNPNLTHLKPNHATISMLDCNCKRNCTPRAPVHRRLCSATHTCEK